MSRNLPRWLSAVPTAAAAWMVGVILVERLAGGPASKLGEQFNQLVFVDFFAAFLTVFLVPIRSRRRVWREWSGVEKCLSLLGAALVILVGVWLLHGLRGWILTLPWMAGISAGWRDTSTLSRRAGCRVGWGLASAFFVALFASILGEDLDTFLRSDPRGTFAWAVLYFGGIALAEITIAWRVLSS